MSFLGDIFDDIVEIGTTPFKIGGKLVDDFAQTNLEDWVNETKDAIKIKSGECPRCERQMMKYKGVYICKECEHIIEL